MNKTRIKDGVNRSSIVELQASELQLVNGGGRGDLAMSFAGGWTSTVAGFAVGAVIGGTRGALFGGVAGFVIGAAIAVGYSLATGGGSGSRYRIHTVR